MNVYIYDKTFDGLLTAVFDAYFRKTFPDFLLSEGDALPLFYDEPAYGGHRRRESRPCVAWFAEEGFRFRARLPHPEPGCRNCRI